MASLLDDIVDIETRTETTMQKESIEKFLSTYCLGSLDESVKGTVKNVKISRELNQSEDIVKRDFAPISLFKYLGNSTLCFYAYRFFLLRNGNIKPIYGGFTNEVDTIVIKGYPHKQLPPYIKFESEYSNKPLKVVLCNCTYDDIEIPGVDPENIVIVHSSRYSRYKLYF